MRPVGPWPAWPGFERTARAALWVDGGVGGAVAAAWLDRLGVGWVGLLPEGLAAPRHEAASRLATLPLRASLPTDPADIAVAARTAQGAGASVLVLPLAAADEPADGLPLVLRLHALQAGLAPWWPGQLWAPLWRRGRTELGRFALALGVPEDLYVDCELAPPCDACPGCEGRRRALVAVGRRPRGLPLA